ncbi:MAG: PVC-type heme-binding CxxCH protein, partial [Haloferula sp.]
YPHIYELIDQHADHYHWDTGKNWQQSRHAAGLSDELGGGHAHVGMTIYQADQFPAHYRGKVFTTNLHGRRVNVDRLDPDGSGYVGRHEPDFMSTSDPWFRAVEISTGPHGSIYILDWSDIGECHEHDGVHRTSGRIYRISYGEPTGSPVNLEQLNNEQLLELQSSTNEWMVRMSRWVLRERFRGWSEEQRRVFLNRLRGQIEPALGTGSPLLAKRWLWLIATLTDDPFDHFDVKSWLDTGDPSLARQTIHLLSNHSESPIWKAPGELTPELYAKLSDPTLVASHPSVRLSLASLLPRLTLGQRIELTRLLMSFAEDADDHNLPLLIWSGICELPPPALAGLFENCRIPKLRRFISRRVAAEIKTDPITLNQLLATAGDDGVDELLGGMLDAFHGWDSAPRPAEWDLFNTRANERGDRHQDTLRLAILFGDHHLFAELKSQIDDKTASVVDREKSLQTLIALSPPDLRSFCEERIDDPELGATAVQGLGGFKDKAIDELLLSRYAVWPIATRKSALNLLASRPTSAKRLLDSIDSLVPREDITVSVARQIRNLQKEELEQLLQDHVGYLNPSNQALEERVSELKRKLTPTFLSRGIPGEGRTLFDQRCGGCHVLFGSGRSLGPDLTGSGRLSVDYLIENIIHPSAVVAKDQAMTLFTLRDGRLMAGVVREEDQHTIKLATASHDITIRKTDVRKRETVAQSMMPAGLLDDLGDEELAHLFAFLMSQDPVSRDGATKER